MERTPSNNEDSKDPKENDVNEPRRGHVREKIDKIEKNKAESKPKIERTRKSFAEKQKNNAKNETNKEIFEENKAESEPKKEEFEAEIAESEQDKQIFEKNKANSEEETGELKKALAESEQETEEFKKKLDELQQENENLKRKLANSEGEKYKLQQENDELEKKIEEYKETIAKSEQETVWRNLFFYAEWREKEIKAVTMTLDAATAHPALHLSDHGRRVTWQERGQDLPSSTQRFQSLPCVLGQLHISSSRCYWEVEVGNAPSWDLGVCRDNVTRKGRVTMSPQNGFWVIRLYSGEYWAITSPATLLTVREKPLKVGIFVDYEDGDVSFFNITDGSHLFSFRKNTFHGVLRPLFRLWSSDSGSLSICPGEGKELTDVIPTPKITHKKY